MFKNYSKSENRKEYIQLIKRVHMYFFSNSFCIHVTNSENFIENLSYRKRCCIHYKRGGVGERSRSSSRTVGDVNATGFPPDPRHLQFAGVGLYTPAFGPKRRWWVVYISVIQSGVGLYTPAFGSKRRYWALHAGVEFETSVLVVHTGVWFKISVLGCKGRHFLRGT